MDNPYEHLWVALDFDGLSTTQRFLNDVKGVVKRVKVGLELFCSVGPFVVVRLFEEFGVETFLDLKFKDIPNTMKGAVRSVVGLRGLNMFNIHGDNTLEAIEAANSAKGAAKLIAVTVLTTYKDDWVDGEHQKDVRPEDTADDTYGEPAGEAAGRFTMRAMTGGADGIVCAATDLRSIIDDLTSEGVPIPPNFRFVVPGIRLEGGSTHDQVRIGSPKGAIQAGATDLVLGRAVIAPDSGTPLYALETVAEEMANA